MDKKPFIERLKKELPELKKSCWSKIVNETQEDSIWKNIETNTPGTMQYSQEMIDRLNTEYEPVSKDEWYDDWKYR